METKDSPPDKKEAEKKELRKSLRALRDAIPEQERLLREKQLLCEMVQCRELERFSTVYLYHSFQSEFPTGALFDFFRKEGKKVLFPRIRKDRITMDFYPVTSPSQLVRGYMGIAEPVSDGMPVLEDGIMFLPGLAFDRKLGRLGYGGGFYDRFLERAVQQKVSIFRVGLCFREQLIERVPRYAHDIILDQVIAI